MKKTILITGGFGFLGGRLGQFLSNDYSIILGTRFNQKAPSWLPAAKVSIIDWCNEHSLNASCESVDVIIHASGLNAQECIENPKKALLVNGVYTQNLVKAAVNQSVKKIIYLSTAHVYHQNLNNIITEETPTINTHPYATSHVAGEDAILNTNKDAKIEGLVCRIANIFGSPVNKTVNCWMLLVNDLCKQAVVEKSLKLNSNSEVVRDFVTSQDFCSAIKFLIEKKVKGNVINIGSGKSSTIGEMASRIQTNCLSVLGFKPPIVFKNKSSAMKNILDYQTNYLNNAGFKFINDFDEEIKDLIRFCVKNKDQ